MKPAVYPFSAIVGQPEMKLALLLAAVDWRLGVLLRGDKGSGKTTTARALAALLPAPAPFVNLPIGSTEDRLLGGLNLERALQGEAVLKPGLLSAAHRGVLYVDEINLLPAHLGDMLLDTAASGINLVEREGLSASQPSEFVLLGSMNPEEGLLRPQLLDRFALSVEIVATLDPKERTAVVERRMQFDRDAEGFAEDWAADQQRMRDQVAAARERLGSILCTGETREFISISICQRGVRSLRADLAAMRAAAAYAALTGEAAVEPHHVETVLPLVLAHRVRDGGSRPSPPPSPPPPPAASSEPTSDAVDRIFAAQPLETPAVRAVFAGQGPRGTSMVAPNGNGGPVVGSRLSESPAELDLRATLNHALLRNGTSQPRLADLHERVRKPLHGTRYLFVIDSSGSHAAQERMRKVKGAATSLLARSFKKDDEVAIIVFRGAAAQVLLQPTRFLEEATNALEYLPTGGRTPLAHALDLTRSLLTPTTLLILLTDGRANVSLHAGDPWQEALAIAGQLTCAALVVDTESGLQPLGQSRELAHVLGARCLALEELTDTDNLLLLVKQTLSPQAT